MTHMHRPPMRLSKGLERGVYAVSGLLFFSGLGWLIAHYIFAPVSEFGETAAPSEPWWLRLHGAAAMAALIVFGSLFPGHIARGIAFRQNLRSGLFMLGLMGLLILSGYGLYYAGDEELRPWISLAHWSIGMVAVAGLILHAQLGKRRFHSATPRFAAQEPTSRSARIAARIAMQDRTKAAPSSEEA